MTSVAKAGLGIQAGFGVPYVSQMGLDLTLGPKLTLSAGTNTLDISLGEASVKLAMQEVGLKWHPFAGAFFLGIGGGSQELDVEAVDFLTNGTASTNVTSTVTIAKLGWMWGKDNDGFWFGIDMAFISPSGGEVEVDATGLTATDQAYQDVIDAGEQFAETSYTNITMARLGYIF